jgi:hypothetical protein
MYKLKLGKFMKVRFLDGSGKKIEIGGEIDKNFTIAQGQRITFAEGATFQSKAITPEQELYNQDPMSMTIGLSIKQNLVLMPVRFLVSNIELEEEEVSIYRVKNPKQNELLKKKLDMEKDEESLEITHEIDRIFEGSKISQLNIPNFERCELVSEVGLFNRSIKQSSAPEVTTLVFLGIDELLPDDQEGMQIIGDSTE